MDDDSNAEAGIATSHNKAAQNELDHAKGFERQHDWSINHLDERIFGMFIMLILVILIAVWVFDIPPLVRYGVTIVAGGLFVYTSSMSSKRKKDLEALRQQQVREHTMKAFKQPDQRN